MSILILKAPVIELSTQDDVFLKDATQTTLEISINGKVVDKANLSSRESNPLVWEAESLVIEEVTAEFVISVVIEPDGNNRQLVGSMGLSGQELWNKNGSKYELPLMTDKTSLSLILRTEIMAIDNVQEFLANMDQNNSEGDGPSHTEDTIGQMITGAETARKEFRHHGKIESLEQAISYYEAVIQIIPEDDMYLPDILNNLGGCLCSRYEEFGSSDDLNEAIKRYEAAINLTPEGDDQKPGRLSNLGNVLFARFSRLGGLEDLHNAVQQKQMALNLTPEGDPYIPSRLGSLGHMLLTRFERLGNRADLHNAIMQRERAVKVIADDDPEKPVYLDNLGTTLRVRFKTSGTVADIDNAVALMQMAVDLSRDDPVNAAGCLNNLSISLMDRFDRLGNLADLDRAIIQQQQVVSLTPDSDPSKTRYLSNLADGLNTRYKRLGNDSDINDALFHHQKAVNLTPADDPDKPIRLTNYGSSLYARFERTGDRDDIDNAVVQEQMAVDLTPDDHPDKSSYLTNLGAFLGLRFSRFGGPSDLDNAIKSQQRALELVPAWHPTRTSHLFNLAQSFRIRFERFHDPHDAESAISHLSAAATAPDGPPTELFKAVEVWIRLASRIKHDSLLAAYGCALDLIPLVAWLGLPIADRHWHLIKIGGIAREAAAAAISAEQYDKALEWLEQGRSIVWTQILQLRTPVDKLREVEPDLADRLLQISQLLDLGPQYAEFSDSGDSTTEEEGRKYRALTAEWEALVKQIGSIPNFGNFLQSPTSSRLMRAAQDGPVIVLNIAKTRCDALALLPGLEEVIHIPLPNITFDRIIELRDDLKEHLYSSGIRMRDTRAATKLMDEGDGNCERVLAELWDNLVKPVLDTLAFSPHPDVLPRIWWCATGPLAFLPIHAAGIYGSGSGDVQISNYVISSYIPTLSMLLVPPKPRIAPSFSLLSVIQPSAPGASSIPSTKQELEFIQQQLAGRDHVVLEGHAGTKRQVMKGMKECGWLHLACHGIQKPDEPTKSALLLDDGHLTLDEIVKLNLPHAEFVFLSACQTTTGDESLSEEAVHIAGGMLLAGYRGVVATMWSIRDELAPMVTNEFYGHVMVADERPDHRKAAEALHMSVKKLRETPGIQLTDWIPFVHLGV
ncbi:hypothetical protein CPB86DRAFT_165945 [Serendipita vermifera]|nr:hypothetical protein CPB86DRAFT_165945 [Serendipita vermifera]